MINDDSKIKDIYQHPIGFDIVNKILLQLNISNKVIDNPLILNLKVKNLMKILPSSFDPSIISAIIELLNQHDEEIWLLDSDIKQAWWKEAVFYQIYPRSFNDSNNDGIGDIKGIIAKLDYLKDLGVDAIWLSPIFKSPQDDNGYDISDYYKIEEMFGTEADFKLLLAEIAKRDMRIILDLVVNHTSDQHPWFQKALNNEKAYQDYYFFKKDLNNWTSFFSGSAWNYYQDLDLYALHLFSKKQMDLNWDNPIVRKEVADIVKYYLSMGVSGFRLDVINYISKAKDLPDGNLPIGKMMGYTGIEQYFYGPKLHDYLKELRANAFEPYHGFSIGETPGVGREMMKLLTGDYRKELDMIFNFDHLENPGKTRFDDYKYDLNYYKKYIINYLENYNNHYWMALFFENHDNPRMISKITDDKRYYNFIAKLLAVCLLTLKGTPFIYQGQEMGTTNADFTNISQIKDIESLNLYQDLLSQNKSEAEAFNTILAGSRDHARQNINWLQANNGVREFYKELINIRKTNSTLVYGQIEFVNKTIKDLFTYYRYDNKHKYFIVMNLSHRHLKFSRVNYELLISNYAESKQEYLSPFETNVYKVY